MIYQHLHSPQVTAQCSPETSWDLSPVGGSGFSTQLRLSNLLGIDAGIVSESRDSWNSSPLLSATQQYRNECFPPSVDQVDMAVTRNMYNPVIVDPSNYQPSSTLSRLDETSVAHEHQRPSMALWSLPGVFPGQKTQADDQFTVQVNSSMADRTPRNLFPHFDDDTPRSHDQTTNESQIVTVVVANSSDYWHMRSMTKETQIPLRKMPQNSRTHDRYERERLVVPALVRASQLCTPPDRGTRVETTARKSYQCGFCCAKFSQRQGLKRHSKDKHEPKKRCDFCEKFSWSQGRRYAYRRHLKEKHPQAGVVTVLPSVSATARQLRLRAAEGST